jgi:hypothetical protein
MLAAMVDGQRIHRAIDRESDGAARTQAEAFIAKVRTDAKHDRLNLPKGWKVALPFRDAAAKYLARLPTEGGKDLKRKRSRLDLHLVRRLKKGDRRITYLTVDQPRRLIECAKDSDNPHLYPFIVTGVETSMQPLCFPAR